MYEIVYSPLARQDTKNCPCSKGKKGTASTEDADK